MTSYQRLKQENEELKKEVHRLTILNQRDHLLKEWEKRKNQVLAVDTPTNKIRFVIMGKEKEGHTLAIAIPKFMIMEYNKKSKTISVEGIEL